MRCPDCNFACSDLRDICPQCLLDLRPTKKERGLRVTNPHASYEALAEKVSKTLPRTPSGSIAPRPRRGFLSFFSRNDSSAPHRKIQPRMAETHAVPALPRTTAELSREDSVPTSPMVESGQSPGDKEFSRVDSEISEILEAFDEQPKREAAHNLPQLEQDAPMAETSIDFDLDFGLDAVSSAPEAPSAPPPPSATAETPQDLRVETVSPQSPIELLFSSARKELPAEDSISFGVEQFLNTDNRQDILLLFDLARESLIDPDSEKRYVSAVQTSAGREVEASELTQHLARVEKQINAQVVSLKGGTPRIAQETQPADFESAAPPVRTAASFGRNAAAALVDVFLVIFSAGIILMGLLSVLAPEIVIRIYEGGALSPFAVGDLVTFSVLSLLASSLVYPLFALLAFRSSVGMSVCGLELVSETGREPSHPQAIVRALSFPLSILVGGWLGPTWGKRTLHDWLARTRVVAELPDQDES